MKFFDIFVIAAGGALVVTEPAIGRLACILILGHS